MISLTATQSSLQGEIPLPASKSESNRALIIQALCDDPAPLHNLASARDTQTMMRLLESENHVLDVIDAGTTMRFLAAYCPAVGRDQILTGTPRMCNRPIGILVDALRELGAEIEYWKQEGYPPLHIVSKGREMHGGEVAVQGNISSQFISALLMIGPVLPGGLRLELLGKINSRPYIEMTLDLMHYFGVSAHWEENVIVVKEQPYVAKAYTIESDWSAASYWYAIAALVPEADLFIRGLRKYSRQGDCRIADLMEPFGVKTTFKEEGIHLTRIPAASPQEVLEIDFTTTPDLAQTMAVVSAATGISLRMTGLETLRIKETDRILALQNELGKFGISMAEVEPEVFQVTGTFTSSATPIETYEDHRMAMAFAPLALSQSDPLYIKEPDVVVKSYPEFWEHLELVGINHTEW